MLDNNSQKNQTTDIINNTYPAASALQKFSEKNKKKKTKKKTGKYLLVKGTTQKNQINNFERKNCHHAKITTVRGDGTAPSVFRCFRTDWICKTPRQCQNASRDRYRFPLIVGKRSRWCFAVAKLVPKSRLFFSSSNMISKVAVKNMGLVSSGRRKSGHAARRIAPAANG
ncbi:hypothetical protein T01_13788 [Trichinella spiralis]|uniref:Uncharacterized protein n=1 Tax=Trichinella spiralis TaxID=6334 RepID=A0A0V1BRE4_TRISP|nr:hypothetical protein T01_13788 [Trichinella spiralis]